MLLQIFPKSIHLQLLSSFMLNGYTCKLASILPEFNNVYLQVCGQCKVSFQVYVKRTFSHERKRTLLTVILANYFLEQSLGQTILFLISSSHFNKAKLRTWKKISLKKKKHSLIKQYHSKFLLSGFHLNGHTLGFHPNMDKIRDHHVLALWIGKYFLVTFD